MKKELEQLIFEGGLTDTIEILGKTWTLKTINVSDHTDIVKSLNSENQNLNFLVIKMQTISRALVSVDDIVLDNDEERTEFVGKLPLAIVDKLFTKYDEMLSKLNSSMDDETVKEIKN